MYPYLAQTLPFTFMLFLKKIHMDGLERLPTDKPVLIAANHPTAFFDPVIMCILFDVPIYNMTRGDMFRKPSHRKMMESINMFPVFRARDGYNDRNRNNEVFEYCKTKLEEEKVVSVFVEGVHHLDKQVHPVQKGIARIAFQSFEEADLEELLILPVGINFRHGDVSRDTVMLNVGEAFRVADYIDSYRESSAVAIKDVCSRIEKELRTLCYHIAQDEDFELGEQLLELHRNEFRESILPSWVYNRSAFDGEKKVLDVMNALPDLEKSGLKERVTNYFKALNNEGLSDRGLNQPKLGAWWRLPLLMLLFPVFLVAAISSWPVRYVAKYITHTKIRKAEFKSGVMMGIGHGMAFVYYGLILLVTLVLWNPIWIGFALLLPLLMWFYVLYKEAGLAWAAARKASASKQKNNLIKLRKAIFQDESV